jgi:hypothetical protein
VSGQIEGERYDLHAVTAGEDAGPVGVPHERELVALAEAVAGGEDEAIARARHDALGALGPESFVAAAAVASNFQRMVRIADSTGIPLDSGLNEMSASIREEIGIDQFGSSANTPALSAGRRIVGRMLEPAARFVLPVVASLTKRRS